MAEKYIRSKIWVAISVVSLVIFAMYLAPHSLIKALFVSFYIIWAAFFYLKKIRVNIELVTDGVWWIPYFLVIGLAVLTFSENCRMFLTVQSWSYLAQFAFLLTIFAILYFWEWPPWFDRNKILLDKRTRILLAYLFFIPGLIIWAYSGMSLINVTWDRSKPVAHDSRVIEKAVMAFKNKANNKYIALIEPWRGCIHPYSIFVSQEDFQYIVPKQTIVRVWTKEGFFHFEWVTGIKIVAGAN